MKAIVIGGGPAGLAAANHLADAGAAVTVLEAKGRLGGRATPDEQDGFVLNQGPHALYLGGAARRELRGLGIDPPGALPRSLSLSGVRDGRRRPLLRGAWRELAGLARRARAADPAALTGLTAAEWLQREVPSPHARAVATAAVHVATYAGPLDRLSADAALIQLGIGLRGVRYLHGGWQPLVDALAARARGRGAEIRTGAPVRSLARSEDGWVALTDAGEHRADVVVLAAGGPARAARLLGVDVPVPGPESEASVLDIGLDRLPRRSRRFAVGLDAPLYLSVHGPPARLAPRGAVLVGVASYGRASREELEAFTEAVQPGWRERVRTTRFLPAMTTITAIPTPETGGLAGRPGPAVAGAPGAFLAGDWVGPEGLLLDAALASAAAAARAALDAAREPARRAVAA